MQNIWSFCKRLPDNKNRNWSRSNTENVQFRWRANIIKMLATDTYDSFNYLGLLEEVKSEHF